jgi:hypothetical protein
MLKKIPCLGIISKTSTTNFRHEKRLNSRFLGVWISRYYNCFSVSWGGGIYVQFFLWCTETSRPIWMALETAEEHEANDNPQETYSMTVGIELRLQGKRRSVWLYI